ncbi:MAG: efflux RND transporter permease subunit [Parahaliea sp.]
MAVLHRGIILSNDNAFATQLGYEAGELESTRLLDLLVGPSKEQMKDYLLRAELAEYRENDPPEVTVTLQLKNGRKKKLRLQAHRQWVGVQEVIELYLLHSDDLNFRTRMVKQPWKVYGYLFCLALLTVLPNLLLPQLHINNAPKTYLPDHAPSVVIDEEIRKVFPDDKVMVLLFEGVALFSDGFLQAYEELADELERHPLIEDVIGLTRQDHISGSADGFLVEPLINVPDLDNSTPSERQQRALSDRFARRSLVAADGSAIALVIVPQSLDDSIRHLVLEEEVLQMVKAHQLNGYLSAMAGEIATDVAQMRAILHDNMIFIPATVAVGLLLIWWLFHRWIAVLVTGVVTGLVVSSTIALYVVLQQPFNSIAGIIPPLLSALTIASLVHFYNALHYASKRGLRGRERVDAALDEIRRPALFSALTTSAGLSSLCLSPIPPISTFGLTSAIGVLLIYLIVIHLLPPIFAHFDRQPWPSRKAGPALMDGMVGRLFHLGIRHPAWVTIILLGALLAATPQILKVRVETNILAFFPPDHSLRQATTHIEEKLVGTTPLEILFTTETPSGLIQPEALRAIRDFQQWLESQAEVDKSISIVDFVEEMNWGFNEEREEERRIPEDADLISQYLFIYDGTGLFDFIDEDYRQARVTMNVNVHGANEISTLMTNIESFLERHPVPASAWKVAGAGRLFADQEDLLITGQIHSLGGALLLIFLLMLGLWRSLRDAFICMIPNLSPILLIFILMGFLDIWLDMATAMIASVAVGIAIDDTVHIFHGFIRRYRRGLSPTLALARTYTQAGRAVMTTTIILCTQFILLLASAFVPMGHFGTLTSVGLLTALVFDLLLLPALLIMIYRRR